LAVGACQRDVPFDHMNDGDAVAGHLRWLAQKDVLGQDMYLVGPPGPTRRAIALLYAQRARRAVEYVSISRDTSDADLKQVRVHVVLCAGVRAPGALAPGRPLPGWLLAGCYRELAEGAGKPCPSHTCLRTTACTLRCPPPASPTCDTLAPFV
jgi:hypothetical protein